MLKPIIKAVAVSAVAAVSFSSAAYAQTYANVPFKVNVAATVTAVQGDTAVSIEVEENVQKNLRLPLRVTSSVQNTSKTQGQLNAPAVTGTRGNITLRLPAQPYGKAEVALHSVNGKRVLRGKADAKDAVSGVSRKNVAAGVYMLSVKGADGSMFSTRLTHSGGKMNINVAFGGESVSPSPNRQLGKQAADGDWYWTWDITVSAEDYYDSVYTIDLQHLLGTYDILPTQNITLRQLPPPPPVIEMFVDVRDGKEYKKVKIGEQVWMAENLNYREDEDGNVLGVCYNNLASNCTQYGRLYNWNEAMGGASSSSAVPSGVQGVCPADWHLPSNAEWDVLMTAVGGSSTAARKLKSTSGWNSCGPAGSGSYYVCEDAYGFAALPGGGGYSVGYFNNAGYYGYWWSATELNAYNA